MIPITKPKMTELEINYVNDAISNGWGVKCFDYINQFKSSLKKYFNVENLWLTTSCHGALHTVLMAINISYGDEVIVPDYTWIGTANPVKWLGGKVIGCDVNYEDACIDINDLETKITTKTKAIIVVHTFGNVANIKRVLDLAKRRNVIVIEDCAGAFGSEINGKKVGTIGDFGVFSFNATKMIVTGEGGAIISNNPKYNKKITLISDQGRDKNSSDSYQIKTVGLKYNMSNIQAALGLAQLERFDEIKEKKRKIFLAYEKIFRNNEWFRMQNIEKIDVINNFWLPTIVFQNFNINLNSLIKFVNDNGANIRRSIYTLSQTEPYKKLGTFKNAKIISDNSVCLCTFEEMTIEQVNHVGNLVITFLKKS